jgi:hypothetical protein
VKNDVNVPSKSNKQKKLGKKFSCSSHLQGHCRKEQDPGTLVRGKVPRIHIKMSRIRNTGYCNEKSWENLP